MAQSHLCCNGAGQVVQVPNATLASTTVENLSWYVDRRGRFALLLCPNQSAETLACIKPLVAEAFQQAAVADWQQYLQFKPTSSAVSGSDAADRKNLDEAEGDVPGAVQSVKTDTNIRDQELRAAAKAAGPTQLWDCGFAEVDSAGALVFEIFFCVPHSDVAAFKQVRHEALVAVMQALERKGVRYISRRIVE